MPAVQEVERPYFMTPNLFMPSLSVKPGFSTSCRVTILVRGNGPVSGSNTWATSNLALMAAITRFERMTDGTFIKA